MWIGAILRTEYRYIDAVLSINNSFFHSYVNSLYQSECVIKNTTDAKSYVSYLYIYLKKDVNGKLTTKQLFVKSDGFNFSSVSLACVAIYHQYLLIGFLPLNLLVMQGHDLHMNDNF